MALGDLRARCAGSGPGSLPLSTPAVNVIGSWACNSVAAFSPGSRPSPDGRPAASLDPRRRAPLASKNMYRNGCSARLRSRNAATSTELGADPAHLRLGDPAVGAERLDQVVDLAGGGAVQVGLHDHREQRLIQPPTPLQQSPASWTGPAGTVRRACRDRGARPGPARSLGDPLLPVKAAISRDQDHQDLRCPRVRSRESP